VLSFFFEVGEQSKFKQEMDLILSKFLCFQIHLLGTAPKKQDLPVAARITLLAKGPLKTFDSSPCVYRLDISMYLITRPKVGSWLRLAVFYSWHIPKRYILSDRGFLG